MSRMVQAVLKTLALAVALLFLFGAVLTSVTDVFGTRNALAAAPERDAGLNGDSGLGPERTFFPATKSAPMRPPRPRDGGQPVFFPASKSAGGMALPGTGEQLKAPPQQSPAQQHP